MIKEFECDGIWWLPDKPDKKVPGTLSFTPDKGASLELKDFWRSVKEGPQQKPRSEEIILGSSNDGEEQDQQK